MTFLVGDVVQLNSGGPSVTVTSVNFCVQVLKDGQDPAPRKIFDLEVVWHDGHSFVRDRFFPDCVRKVQ